MMEAGIVWKVWVGADGGDNYLENAQQALGGLSWVLLDSAHGFENVIGMEGHQKRGQKNADIHTSC